VLALIVGILSFFFPGKALFAFTFVFAAYCGVDGIASIIAGVRGATQKEHRWGALILRGLLGIAVAVLFVLMPLVATVSYALVILGALIVWALLGGVLEIAAAIRLRRVIEGEWLLGLSGLFSILLGLAILYLLMVAPIASIISVGWVIGVWATVSGVALISLGLRLRGRQASAG
jgi:uncharacterized membrane protein HdeD (DUF308 family)